LGWIRRSCAYSLIVEALVSDGARSCAGPGTAEHEAAAVQAWLGRRTSIVFGCLFRRGLSLGSTWPANPDESGPPGFFCVELPQTTMSPQYLQFTKGRGSCNKIRPAAGAEKAAAGVGPEQYSNRRADATNRRFVAPTRRLLTRERRQSPTDCYNANGGTKIFCARAEMRGNSFDPPSAVLLSRIRSVWTRVSQGF
jgi:hypothetical protein